MASEFRICADPPSLSDRGRAWLTEAGVSYRIVSEPAALSRLTAPDAFDVLYVPAGEQPNLDRATEMLACSGSKGFGILSDEAGLLLHRVGREALSLYYRPFAPQADASAYVAGGDYRAEYGADCDVPAPRQVYLGLTQRCNRSCTFCVSRTFDFDLLSIEQVEQLCDQLRGAVDIVALTGAGEAMTHPHFWEIMDLLCERLPGVQFKMNTSGVALTRKAHRLLEYPIKNITVSLNAATEPTYGRLVGPGFDAVLKGIGVLVDGRAELRRSDLHLCLSMVLMNSTIAEMAGLATLAAELGIEEVQGIYLMINDDVLASESPWHEPERSNRLLAEALRRAASLGVRASLPPPFRIGETRAGSDQLTSLPTTQGQRCTEAWSTVYIRPNCDIIACPYMDRAMGNIGRQTLEEVWNGQPYRDLRRGLISRDFCQECRHCCGFNEAGSVDEYWSHWLGRRRPRQSLPLISLVPTPSRG